MTETIDPALGKAEDVAKSLWWDLEIKALLMGLHLDFWPLNAVFTWFTDKLYSNLRLGVDMLAIPFINNTRKQEFISQALLARFTAEQKGVDSEEFKKVVQDAQLALNRFVRVRGGQ